MANDTVAAKAVLESMASSLPLLPTDAQWALISEAASSLDLVSAAVSKLQTDHALLAHYMPVTCCLCNALQRKGAQVFSAQYASELDGVEERNICEPLVGPMAAKCDCLKSLARCTALAHPRYRAGWFLKPKEKDATFQRFWQHCLTQYMLAHGVPEDGYRQHVPFKWPHAGGAQAKRLVQGMAELECNE